MRKKYWGIILFFSIICIALPFILDILYDIGEEYLIIVTIFSADEMLGYITAAISLIISLIALCISLSVVDINLNIHHAVTVSENNKQAIVIEIQNKNNFDCNIDSIELCNKKKKNYAHIINTPSFMIKAREHECFIVEVDRLLKL